ncbi:hypothetical protein A3K55_00780 [Candidatus Shapirobacteria bacterium RBG_13_44_7]|uniref:Uncharacterized protein n=1 Tax=Candidatus Shapirobacteria bacterium RBG_13_44_7 TaxID=1802149 RepID=A0A1F7SJ50_9BACT|nr:MAG: hypothetical protein A3K55_00780 [Candidatus Shapirobacteria bacterium RBG_13_44_7]
MDGESWVADDCQTLIGREAGDGIGSLVEVVEIRDYGPTDRTKRNRKGWWIEVEKSVMVGERKVVYKLSEDRRKMEIVQGTGGKVVVVRGSGIAEVITPPKVLERVGRVNF